MQNHKTLALIIPCYNEASRGRLTKKDLSKRLVKIKNSVKNNVSHVIFVNDGSKDTTASEIRMFIKSNHLEDSWFVIDEKVNKGKGHSLLLGMEKAAHLADFIGYVDADLSTSIPKMCELPLEHHPNTAFVGNRVYMKKQPFLRAIVSRLAKISIRLFSGVKSRDTQCPFKVVPSDVFLSIKDNLVGYRWLYDVELLWELQNSKCVILEMPVLFNNMDESTLHIVSAVKRSVTDLLHFYKRKAKNKKAKRSKKEGK